MTSTLNSKLSRRSGQTRVAATIEECDWDAALAHFRAAADRPVFLARDRVRAVASALPEASGEIIAAADRVASLRFTYFGYEEVELADPIDWNFDPIRGVRWPQTASSKIEYRTFDGDVKWIWELNRLQHLPWLAQAWLLTGDDRYSRTAFHQLSTWIDQNPPGSGIAWRNAFEVGVRSISIALALQGFRDSPDLTSDLYRRTVALLAEGADRCWRERSRFSSANNHLIGELAGLAVVAILLPELPHAADWERRALGQLAVEAELQLLSDGAGAEQAVGYQVFSSELLMVVAALLIERDGQAPKRITDAIERSAGYLAALVGRAGPEPRYGDDDDGFALRLGTEPRRTVSDHLDAAAAMTVGRITRQGNARTWTAQWLAEICRHRQADPAATSLQTLGNNHFAPAGGLAVLRGAGRTALMDVGPLGYLSIAAHGHADALAVTVSVDGQDVIGDPGAGSYFGHPDWRRAHRSTRAHATVEVDDRDQSVTGGPFLWTAHARVRVNGIDLESGVVDAEHLGYRRLHDSVIHRRWLVAPPSRAAVLVVDLVCGGGRHLVRTSWPLHPSLDAIAEHDGYLLTRDGAPVAQLMTAATVDLVFEQVRGDTATALGWWSEQLESRTPAWLVGARCLTGLPVVIATVIQPTNGRARVADLKVRHHGAAIDVTWTDAGQRNRAAIDTTRFGTVTMA
ncbi:MULTISPECIES: alginate lyase family protein [unclassified Mycobacterium]|uniref:heparinase II/III family protein n=1 Tax=unclassified Mycobacterium TaxID=2642494 RepID=UPI0029C7179F|nr:MULTISPECIES: alginate lyase family protein [unclassified Mycobacterium]